MIAAATAVALFVTHCAGCHGDDARGTAKGPGLVGNGHVAGQTVEELEDFLKRGNPGAGMPAFGDLAPSDLVALASYVRTLAPSGAVPRASSAKISWRAPQPGDWLTYNGSYSGNRYSELKQITVSNVSNLRLKWIYPTANFGLETTPLASDGVLYFTGPNQVIAVNALTGAELWKYGRAMTPGMQGDAKLGTNRGVGILDDKVFFVTDNAHLLALSRTNGELLWEVPMFDEPYPYGGTMAPLVVDGNVVVGVAGADHGIRGFVAAFRASDGGLVWRHYTVAEKPVALGGSTWLTGSYDEETGTLYCEVDPSADTNRRGTVYRSLKLYRRKGLVGTE